MYDTDIKIMESMKRKKTDVEYGNGSLAIFLMVVAIAYIILLIAAS